MQLYQDLQDRQPHTQQNAMKSLGQKKKKKEHQGEPQGTGDDLRCKACSEPVLDLSKFRLNSGGEPALGPVLSMKGY